MSAVEYSKVVPVGKSAGMCPSVEAGVGAGDSHSPTITPEQHCKSVQFFSYIFAQSKS